MSSQGGGGQKLPILLSKKTTKRGGGGQKLLIKIRHSLWTAPNIFPFVAKGQKISKADQLDHPPKNERNFCQILPYRSQRTIKHIFCSVF